MEEALRDKLAMAALTGLLSAGEVGIPYNQAADIAYGYADAMMERRKMIPGVA